MGLLDELLKAQKPKRNLMGTQMVKGPDQSYLRQDYPGLYGALGGLLGTAPDVMEGSVLDPNTAAVRQGAEYTFPVGTALAMLPGVGPAQRGAMAVGRAGERLAERAVPQVMDRGGLLAEIMQGMSQGSRSQIFVGKNSKTWNAGNAAKAVELEEAGVSPENIWAATGTFRGPEGKLRQEISDEFAIPKGGGSFKDIIMNGYERGSQRTGDQLYKTNVNDVLLHKQLNSAYPEIMGIETQMMPRGKTSKGSFAESGDSSVLHINENLPSNESRSVMLHELQHAVQQREGFAAGGNPEMFSMPNELKQGMHSYEDMRRAALLLEKAKRDGVAVASLSPRWATNNIKSIAQTYENMPSGMDALTKNIDLRLQIDDPVNAYQRLAGEAEARAVQSRMNMTPQERMATFPYQSYDVPVNQLIVRTKQMQLPIYRDEEELRRLQSGLLYAP